MYVVACWTLLRVLFTIAELSIVHAWTLTSPDFLQFFGEGRGITTKHLFLLHHRNMNNKRGRNLMGSKNQWHISHMPSLRLCSHSFRWSKTNLSKLKSFGINLNYPRKLPKQTLIKILSRRLHVRWKNLHNVFLLRREESILKFCST